MPFEIKILITCAVAIFVGIILGNSAVYFFNKMPGKWLVDYGEEPSEELLNPTTQRVKSFPYKYIFSVFFVCTGLYLGVKNPWIAFPVLFTLWLLLEMSIADIKYRIVPDQLIMILVLAGIGFLPHHARGIMDCLIGAAAGLVLMLSVLLLTRVITKKWALGGADIKLFATLGLCSGTDGILTIFVLSTFMAAVHIAYRLIKKETSFGDFFPMVPYISAAAGVYFIFLHDMMYGWVLSL